MPKAVIPALKKTAQQKTAAKKTLQKNGGKRLFGFLKKNEKKEEVYTKKNEEMKKKEVMPEYILEKSSDEKKSVLGLSFDTKKGESPEKKKNTSGGFLKKFAFGKTKRKEKENFENTVKTAEEDGVVSVSMQSVLPEKIEEKSEKKKIHITGENSAKEKNEIQKEKTKKILEPATENIKKEIHEKKEREHTEKMGELSFGNTENAEKDSIIQEEIEKKDIHLNTEKKNPKNQEEAQEKESQDVMQNISEEKKDSKNSLVAGILMDNEEEPKEEQKNSLVSAVLAEMEKEEEEKPKEAVLSLSEKLKKRDDEVMLQKQKVNSRLLATARFLFLFSFAVPLSAFVIFQTILVENSGLSHALSAQNYGTELTTLKDINQKKTAQITTLKKEIIKTQKDIDGIRNEKILTEITDNRIDFLEIMLRINSITLQSLELTPEVNRVINMLVFNSYSASIDKDGNASINISGTVRDPKRMSFTKLTTLMETINKDPFFSGANIRSFSKSDDNEGGAKSSFTFNISYIKDPTDTTQIAKNKK